MRPRTSESVRCGQSSSRVASWVRLNQFFLFWLDSAQIRFSCSRIPCKSDSASSECEISKNSSFVEKFIQFKSNAKKSEAF
ncbi:hypothetical protein L596_013616 [Steinernema carpocapsae]|uniref:Uncharacterized protein n=1 Tax=Steinernema carpocapsae TaxID=34508 RepID=A0A4V6A549_STECR|nr:hypothetical protein L596_013616 [Steinernema carpocapsae]